jgi:hypothetical protein
MNTDKPGAPFYQRSVEETLASVQSTPEGISGQKRPRACSSMAKTPCRRSRVNRPGCVLWRILTMC